MQPIRLIRLKKVILSILVSVITLTAQIPIGVYAAEEKHRVVEDLPFEVDGNGDHIVKALHYKYTYNRYVSLRDIAFALSGTAKHFELSVTGDGITITTGQDYVGIGGEGEPFPEPEIDEEGNETPYIYTTYAMKTNAMTVDGRKVKYFTFLGHNTEDKLDCFMSVTDLAMLLDADMRLEDDRLTIDTSGNYTIDLQTLEEEGFYHEVHSALVGDATTGEIYAAWEPDLSVPIASTTKLMTYLCVMDAVTDGVISMSDTVIITPEAEELSKTADGVIAMEAGDEATIEDLLVGMLLPSSNECALSLAIHVSGSEEAFVEKMNRKARTLGLSEDTVFYNSNGLPVFSDSLAASKIQNHMSARDMFALVGHILRVYPEITRITSMQSAQLESFHTSVSNTNPLLYNLPGVVGLKTGTTTMSGACLVSAMEVAAPDGTTHTIVAMEFGAEDGTVRCTLSEEMIRYGRQQLLSGGSSSPAPADKVIPGSAEELIRLVLRNM